MDQPFKSYNGGKSGNGTYQQIINFIPQCEIFIDAMVGNGGIVSKLKLPKHTVINDIDAGLIDKYSCEGPRIIKERLDIGALIDKYDMAQKAFFYFDPPYLKSTRRGQQDLYKFEWDEMDHLNFLNRILMLRNKCMVSHYPCEMYNHYLKGWKTHLFESMTRTGKAVECIYMNYEQPLVLQDYRYLGNNFTERQRIKRKSIRWVTRLEALPLNERTAIISAVIDKYNYVAGIILNK